ELRPDIPSCHSTKAGGVGRLAGVGLGVPGVYNPHGWSFSMSGSRLRSAVYLWLERALSPLTTRFVTISNYEKLIAVQRHIARAERISTIFNGIDMEDVGRQLAGGGVSRASLGIPADACVIGMVGRISRQKAPDTFVRMAARLGGLIPEAWFMIVGDGDEREETERLIAEEGLEGRFTITGWVGNPLAYANLFDTAVLLSRWEGFGLVLAEFMKLGKPIVATETDAIPDLITDHENGLLVEADNPAQAAEAVMEIHEDVKLREDMIRKGLMRADAFFDIRRTAREHGRLFVKICETGGVKCEADFARPRRALPAHCDGWRAAA
ncbi:MAG: glycosyltransferase, partial [Prevotellaceae bacterium]|nr:glycosyltransferase [Prevotellaceae bacterium]